MRETLCCCCKNPPITNVKHPIYSCESAYPSEQEERSHERLKGKYECMRKHGEDKDDMCTSEVKWER
jgi:hypothetical protein